MPASSTLRVVDRVCLFGLAFGTLGHSAGTFVLVERGTQLFVWSLAGSLACFATTAINAMRQKRGAADGEVAALSLVLSAAWTGVAVMFGASIGNVLDPRAAIHAASAVGLAACSYLDVMRQ